LIDQKIITLCCSGNQKGFSELYKACIPYVYSTVKRYIHHEEDRKDIVQEAFAKVFLNIASYNSQKGTFNTWLRTVTVNECLMHLRKAKKLSMLAPVELKEDLSAREETDLNGITREDIENILKTMPEGYRIIFMLSVIDGYNHKEIAELLGIKSETSRSQLSRAKNWIKKHISNQKIKNAYGLF